MLRLNVVKQGPCLSTNPKYKKIAQFFLSFVLGASSQLGIAQSEHNPVNTLSEEASEHSSTSLPLNTKPSQTIDNQRVTVQFRIRGSSLENDLTTLAIQANIQLICNSALLDGKNGKTLTGEFTIEDALAFMLADTGLVFSFYDESTVLVKAISTQPKEKVAVTAVLEEDSEPLEEFTLPEIVVVGETTRLGCCHHETSTATKTYAPTIEVPQSLEGIDSQMFRSRGNANLKEAFRDYASVNITDKVGNINIRGFALSDSAVLKDGLPAVYQGNSTLLLQNIDGIEVAKGANSTLYGYGEPGGVINLISKKPIAHEFNQASVSVGTYDSLIAFDSNAPTTSIDNLSYRANLIARKEVKNGDVRDKTTQLQIAPSFLYQFEDDGQLHLQLEYSEQETETGQGVQIFEPTGASAPSNDQVLHLPLSVAQDFAAPDSNLESDISKIPYEAKVSEMRWLYETTLENDWHYGLSVHGGEASQDIPLYTDLFASLSPINLNDSSAQVSALDVIFLDGGQDFLNVVRVESALWGFDTNLSRSFEIKESRHDILFGVNYSKRELDSVAKQPLGFFLETLSFLQFGEAETADLIEFGVATITDEIQTLYGDTASLTDAEVDTDKAINLPPETDVIFSKQDLVTSSLGFYIQDHVHFSEQWKLLVAGAVYQYKRHYKLMPNNLSNLLTSTQVSSIVESSPEDTVFSPRLGITYLLNPDLAFYSSYGKQFNVNNAVNIDGSARDAEKTNASEIGVKWWPNKNLNLSFNLFRIDKTNWEATDHNLQTISRTGELRSTGGELNVSGFLFPHWKVALNYSHHSIKSLDGENLLQSSLRSAHEAVPDENLNFWIQYQQVPYGEYGWSIGVGGAYLGDRSIERLDESVSVDSYTIYDAGVSYLSKKLKVSLNIDNITNEEWFEGLSSIPVISKAGYNLAPGHGTRVRLSTDWFF